VGGGLGSGRQPAATGDGEARRGRGGGVRAAASGPLLWMACPGWTPHGATQRTRTATHWRWRQDLTGYNGDTRSRASGTRGGGALGQRRSEPTPFNPGTRETGGHRPGNQSDHGTWR
jgi:hypothetical protein